MGTCITLTTIWWLCRHTSSNTFHNDDEAEPLCGLHYPYRFPDGQMNATCLPARTEVLHVDYFCPECRLADDEGSIHIVPHRAVEGRHWRDDNRPARAQGDELAILVRLGIFESEAAALGFFGTVAMELFVQQRWGGRRHWGHGQQFSRLRTWQRERRDCIIALEEDGRLILTQADRDQQVFEAMDDVAQELVSNLARMAEARARTAREADLHLQRMAADRGRTLRDGVRADWLAALEMVRLAEERAGALHRDQTLPYLPRRGQVDDRFLAISQFDQGEDCPICKDAIYGDEADGNAEPEEVRILPCKHRFHYICATEWFDTGANTCPYCRHSYNLARPTD